ncbi:MAG TPA: metallophosphoesterase [candidate division Zixibacteria bacterium]|nr:metallophosphoesterase [candidate division Zixibacteria bacterium]
MRVGFFSDVHGNWEALAACLKDFETAGLNKLFFLGDAVGYGADPDRVVEKVVEISDLKILGNHDAAVIGQLSPDYFNEYARASFFFTRETMKPENLQKLREFSISETWSGFTLVHALPKDPESWGYISTLQEAQENFAYFQTQICLIGHSHRPFIVEQKDGENAHLITAEYTKIEPNCRYIINVGSVGQPRDGNPDACYVTYDEESKEIYFKRIKYDIKTAQEKMKQAQIPGYLVERLSLGR